MDSFVKEKTVAVRRFAALGRQWRFGMSKRYTPSLASVFGISEKVLQG